MFCVFITTSCPQRRESKTIPNQTLIYSYLITYSQLFEVHFNIILASVTCNVSLSLVEQT